MTLRASFLALSVLGAGLSRPALAAPVTVSPQPVMDIPPVEKPIPLGPYRAQLVETSSLIRATQARSTHNVNGSGLTIAVLDTGINTTHSDFAGRITIKRNYTPNDGGDITNVTDRDGHGTNVASLAMANGTHTGIAPGANVAVFKVLGDDGRGSSAGIDGALQWLVDNAEANNISVVNMSLGGSINYSDDSTVGRSLYSQLRAKNIAVVVSAGNDYGALNTQGMAWPAIIRETVSVGALYDANIGGVGYGNATANTTAAGRITPFSQRLHPTFGTAECRTDIFAPGAALTGAGIAGNTSSSTMHGTSQAAPVLAGVILLMQQKYKAIHGVLPSVDLIENLLRASAVTINDGDDEDDSVTNTGLNFLRVDALNALDAIRTNSAPVATAASLFVPWNTSTNGTLSGSDFENSTLTFAKASDPVNGTVTVSSTGSFTYTPTTGYRGTDSFTFTVSDGTITSSPATINLTVKEDVRPGVVITAPSNNARLHLSELGSGSILGTATDNFGVNRVQVLLRRYRGTSFSYWNGTTFSATYSTVDATLSGTGTDITWSLDSAIPASELDAGTYFLSALANDEAFNSRYSATHTLTLYGDGTAPGVAISAPTQNQRLQTSELISGSIHGTATDNVGVARVRIVLRRFRGTSLSYWNGSTFVSTHTPVNTTLSSNGTDITWSLQNAIPAAQLDVGTYHLTAVATDAAGNTTHSATRNFTLTADTTAPTVTISAPTQKQRLHLSELVSGSINGTATDSVGVARVWVVLRRFRSSGAAYWNGSSFVSSHTPVNTTLSSNGTNITWSLNSLIPAAQLDAGSYFLTAVASDAAGNTTHSSTREFILHNDGTTSPTSTLGSSAGGS